MATKKGPESVNVYKTPRSGSTPNAINNKGLRPHWRALMPDHDANNVTTIWVVTTQADMNIIEARPCPLESISPSSGNMAAFAKWNKTAQIKKSRSGRSFNRWTILEEARSEERRVG